jgi:membrane protein DedA with SNARE-associated domain
MATYLHGLLDFVAGHPNLAFAAVFLLALSEAIPVVGTVVPGSSLILGICALVAAADVEPWPLLVAAFLGAVVGDGISFWLGYQYRREILREWPLNRFPRLIVHSSAFVKKYGVASVFLARFMAVVRAFVPLLAGIFRMSSGRFYFANVLIRAGVGAAPCLSRYFRRHGDRAGRRAHTTTRRAGHRCCDRRCDPLERAKGAASAIQCRGAAAARARAA